MASPPRSALARPLDVRYPSNRVALLGTVLAVLVERRRGRTWLQALDRAGLGFLAWATARELDPDHPMTANAALPLAALMAGWSGPGESLAGFGVLSGLRLLAGTTGDPQTPVDHLAMLAQAALGARSGGKVAALLPATAAVVAGGLGGALPLLGLLVPQGKRTVPGGWSVVPLVAGLVVGPIFARQEVTVSVCDRADRPVRAQDVRRARLSALTVLGLGLATRRPAGLLPLACAVISVGLRRLTRP